MPNDSGLYFILRKLLGAKTKKEADAYINEYVSEDYMKIAQELAGRLSYQRTIPQNSLIFKWYSEVGKQMGETADEVRCRAKLDIGCVIMRRDDPVFNGFFEKSIAPLSRERQLKSMRFISMTSLMNTKQATEYLDSFEHVHRAQGLQLTQPEAA